MNDDGPTTPEPARPEGPAEAEPARPALSRIERREKAVADALRTLVRDLQLDRFGVAVRAPASGLRFSVSFVTRPDRSWELEFDPPLREQVLAHLEEAEAGAATYQRGRLYCFRCESAECAHARPPSSISVFSGYAPTGEPEWHDLAQAFIEARDDRVDRLYAAHAEVVTRVQLGHDLRQRQLSSFGKASKTYSVLGQVAAGYFRSPADPLRSRPDRRLAITFQAVEARAPGGAVRLELNAIANTGPGLELDELMGSDWEPWVHRAYALAERALKSAERRANAARDARRMDAFRASLAEVPAILRRLSEFLERGHRQTRWRTRHVEERRQDHRPVHKAIDDARSARPESVFHDEKTRALVVCGEQGRAHVFNPDGRHVTSFVLKPGGADFRVRTRRWRPATTEEAAELTRRASSRAPSAEGAADEPERGEEHPGRAV